MSLLMGKVDISMGQIVLLHLVTACPSLSKKNLEELRTGT